MQPIECKTQLNSEQTLTVPAAVSAASPLVRRTDAFR